MFSQKTSDSLLKEHFRTEEGTRKATDAYYRIQHEEDYKFDLYVLEAQERYGYSEDTASALVRESFEDAYDNFATLAPQTDANEWIHGFILTLHEKYSETKESIFQYFVSQVGINNSTPEQELQKQETLKLIKANIAFLVATEKLTFAEGIAVIDTLEPFIKRTPKPRKSQMLEDLGVDCNFLGTKELCGLKDEDGPAGFEKIEQEAAYFQLNLNL